MTEALQLEIRTLRSLYRSERDPAGRVFAPLADAYRRAGRIPEAVRLLQEGLPEHPDFVTGHVVAAQLYVEQGLVEEAALAARRALELDHENVLALHALLRVLHEKGEMEEAASVRDRLSRLDPELAGQAPPARAPTSAPAPAHPSAATSPALATALELEPASFEPVSFSEAPTVELRAVRDEEPAGDGQAPFAPDPEPMLDLDALGALSLEGIDIPTAPREPSAWDALAPEPGPEPVFEVGTPFPAALQATAIAGIVPEAGEEPVVGIGALAPEAGEEPVVEIGALAPEAGEEPVVEIGALAPEAADSEPLFDVALLSPEAEAASAGRGVTVKAAPREIVIDLDALRSSPRSPSGPERDVDVPGPDSDAEAEDADAEVPLYTRTLAELYVKQGAIDRALVVLRHLREADPGDRELARRIAELESGAAGERPPASEVPVPSKPPEAVDEAETLARDLAYGGGGHDVESPFAWGEHDPDPVARTGPTIREYFERLLAWEPEARS